MYKNKTCIICGKSFIPKVHNSLCCCSECSKEYAKKLSRDNYYKNIERQRERNRLWKLNNKDRVKEYNKAYREKNKEYFIQYKKEHREHENTIVKNRLKNDKYFKIKNWCREQIKRCLLFNKGKQKKEEHTFDILGYTPNQLKQRLESQFKNGMTWENHGILWHIHHKKPLHKFKFLNQDGCIDYQQIFLANCLANLQPLTIEEHKKVHAN